MKFIPEPLAGAFLIEPERHEDERGFFARMWCQREFAAHGITSHFVQCSISYNRSKGTLRGMHFQLPPYAEDKLVHVTRGRIFDVIVDLRPDSDTFLRWLGVELTEENRLALYIPQGFAHGFETLVDDTEVFYQMTEFYMPDYGRGFRWDDPLIGITWPEPIKIIAERDRTYTNLLPDDFVKFQD
jgi:dTDP-4-dehydrorhamnose 3,5-epimerase